MKTPRTFVMGDIHGAYRALRQCLERSGFNFQSDVLIFLGDVCDGWPETKSCFDELLKIEKLVFILGNHDAMSMPWMMDPRIKDEGWLMQGGDATIASYGSIPCSAHLELLQRSKSYYKMGNAVFTHAGFDPAIPLEVQHQEVFAWDRSLARKALNAYKNGTSVDIPFNEVYLGHTPIPFDKPICAGGIWMMDTGAGWKGRLSMMDVDTKEITTSDSVVELYPGVKGRGG